MTIGEIATGIGQPHVHTMDDARTQVLRRWLDDVLIVRLAGRLLDVDRAVAGSWGLLGTRPGRPR